MKNDYSSVQQLAKSLRPNQLILLRAGSDLPLRPQVYYVLDCNSHDATLISVPIKSERAMKNNVHVLDLEDLAANLEGDPGHPAIRDNVRLEELGRYDAHFQTSAPNSNLWPSLKKIFGARCTAIEFVSSSIDYHTHRIRLTGLENLQTLHAHYELSDIYWDNDSVKDRLLSLMRSEPQSDLAPVVAEREPEVPDGRPTLG